MLSRYKERTLKTEAIYQGKIIHVHLEEVELPNGKRAMREIVRHPGAVAVIAVTPENKLIMVRQYRKPLDKTILEIPAGKLEKGEDPLDCARRELMEETGYSARSIRFVTSFYTSPGFADEILYIYEAEDLQPGASQPDEDEFVDLVELDLHEAFSAMRSGDIHDAKTIFALYYWENKQLKGNG